MKKILLCAVFIAASFTSIAQVGIGTANPDASAALEIESTTKGLLLPRMMLGQINAITTPAEGLMVYCLDCKTKGYFVNNGTEFINIRNGNGLITITTVVDITTTTGKTWMDRNLGATQVATSSTDAASYGDLYQWGRDSDGHERRTSNTTATTATSAHAGHGDFILSDAGREFNWTDFTDEDTLWQSGLNDPCPAGYRIPTIAELIAEIVEFNTINAAGAFLTLKITLAGFRLGTNGAITGVGSDVRYWSSSTGSETARFIEIQEGSYGIGAVGRSNGYSVRCIKN
jgi:uncharacterized protein (TIGR02145 family)